MKWFPAKVIWRMAREVVNAAVAKIRAAQRVPHRGTTTAPGGSLPATMRSSEFVQKRRWGAVTRWADAGQALLHFKEGTPKQVARDFETMPSADALNTEIKLDAQRHFEEREARFGGTS